MMSCSWREASFGWPRIETWSKVHQEGDRQRTRQADRTRTRREVLSVFAEEQRRHSVTRDQKIIRRHTEYLALAELGEADVASGSRVDGLEREGRRVGEERDVRLIDDSDRLGHLELAGGSLSGWIGGNRHDAEREMTSVEERRIGWSLGE